MHDLFLQYPYPKCQTKLLCVTWLFCMTLWYRYRIFHRRMILSLTSRMKYQEIFLDLSEPASVLSVGPVKVQQAA
jgi:hypothetical protein